MAIKDCWKANKERKLHEAHVKRWMLHCREGKRYKTGKWTISLASKKKNMYATDKKNYQSGRLPKWMYD